MNDSNREQQDNTPTENCNEEALPQTEITEALPDNGSTSDSEFSDAEESAQPDVAENDFNSDYFKGDDVTVDDKNDQIRLFEEGGKADDAEHIIPPFYHLYNSETPVNMPTGEKQRIHFGKHLLRGIKTAAGILSGIFLAAFVIFMYISSERDVYFTALLSAVIGYLVSGYVYDYAKLISCRLSGIKPLYIRIFCLLFTRKDGEKGKVSVTLPSGPRVACPLSENTEESIGTYISVFSSGIIAMSFCMIASGIIAVYRTSAVSCGVFAAFALKLLFSAIPAYNGGVPNDSVLLHSLLHRESCAYLMLKIYGMFTAMRAGVRPSEIKIPDFTLRVSDDVYIKSRNPLNKSEQTTAVKSSSADDFESYQIHIGEYAAEETEIDSAESCQDEEDNNSDNNNNVQSNAENIVTADDELSDAEDSIESNSENAEISETENIADLAEDNADDADDADDANDDSEQQDVVSDIKEDCNAVSDNEAVADMADEDAGDNDNPQEIADDCTDSNVTVRFITLKDNTQNDIADEAVDTVEDADIAETVDTFDDVNVAETPLIDEDVSSEQEQVLLYTEYLAALDGVETDGRIFEIMKELRRNIRHVPKSLLCTLRREICFLSSVGANEESASFYLKKSALTNDVQSMRVLSYYCYYIEGDVSKAEYFLRRGIEMAQKAIRIKRCSVNCGLYISEVTLMRRLDNIMMSN